MKSIKILFCCSLDNKSILKKKIESCYECCDIKVIKKEEFDLNVKYEAYFFEVDSHDTSGFEKAKYIRKKYNNPLIIFISSSIELALTGYKYNAFRFLMIEKLKEDLPLILNDIKKFYEFSNRFIGVKDKKNQVIPLYFKDIVFLISEGNYIDIHTEDNIFRKRCNVKYFLGICGNEIFIYIEKGILINMRYVRDFNRLTGELTIKSGMHMSVRKKFKENFIREWNRLKSGCNIFKVLPE